MRIVRYGRDGSMAVLTATPVSDGVYSVSADVNADFVAVLDDDECAAALTRIHGPGSQWTHKLERWTTQCHI